MRRGPAPAPGAEARTADPDRTPRRLRARPVVGGVLALAAFAGLVALPFRNGALAMLALAVVGVVVFDAVSARRALAELRPTVTNPVDGVAGEPSVHVVQAHGLTTPVELVQALPYPSFARPSIALRTNDPGTFVVEAPHRGVVTDMVFDLVASGPLGLTEAACRVRVRLPTPWPVGPRPLPHDPVWPKLRTVPPGEATTVTQGDDLFRGVRPYTRGDPRRSVHWPATAHRGTLMVKERDGIEQVALRVVLELTHAGSDAEMAASRAAWLVEHGLARGWRVHLVTVEGPRAAPPPLLGPWAPQPPPRPPGPATHTVARGIERADRARQQLAAAGIGTPTIEKWTGMTRVVSPWGDRWL